MHASAAHAEGPSATRQGGSVPHSTAWGAARGAHGGAVWAACMYVHPTQALRTHAAAPHTPPIRN